MPPGFSARSTSLAAAAMSFGATADKLNWQEIGRQEIGRKEMERSGRAISNSLTTWNHQLRTVNNGFVFGRVAKYEVN